MNYDTNNAYFKCQSLLEMAYKNVPSFKNVIISVYNKQYRKVNAILKMSMKNGA